MILVVLLFGTYDELKYGFESFQKRKYIRSGDPLIGLKKNQHKQLFIGFAKLNYLFGY